ncbi:hypothetical protein [Dyadobacter sp. CY312]|uniref:hypothetical protein n=1 Tax=Dyadobacter sp. CY312 TaxID=2907303 RepID=UPI001F2E7E2D|nr:hypothetical protein [Dyadobacter sp. CY312]MCE7040948.1 hypothetical protein [Dyadobacter sp. CY312]
MKKSNILIVCLIAFSFIAMIGSGLSLKTQFDKIDRNDPYAGFEKTKLKDFKYVKLSGNYYGLTRITYGSEPEIKVLDMKNTDNSPIVSWKMSGDTLMVDYKLKGQKAEFGEYSYGSSPNVYIMVSKLSGVNSNGITTAIQGVKADSFLLEQKGFGVTLKDNDIKQLSTTIHSGANLTIEAKNKLDQTTLYVKDSSSVRIDQDVFHSFRLKADPSVQINLPGSLIKKMTAL